MGRESRRPTFYGGFRKRGKDMTRVKIMLQQVLCAYDMSQALKEIFSNLKEILRESTSL